MWKLMRLLISFYKLIYENLLKKVSHKPRNDYCTHHIGYLWVNQIGKKKQAMILEPDQRNLNSAVRPFETRQRTDLQRPPWSNNVSTFLTQDKRICARRWSCTRRASGCSACAASWRSASTCRRSSSPRTASPSPPTRPRWTATTCSASRSTRHPSSVGTFSSFQEAIAVDAPAADQSAVVRP